MPKRSRREEREVRVRLLVFCLAMFIIVVGLVFVWRKLPYGVETKTETIVTAPVVVDEPESTPVADTTTTTVRERPQGMVCDETNTLCVRDSLQNTLLTSPFTVTGTTIGNNIQVLSWDVADATGTMLTSGLSYLSSTDLSTRTFSLRDFLLTPPKTATGTLRLFLSSEMMGTDEYMLQIPIRLLRQSMDVKIFHASMNSDLPRYAACPSDAKPFVTYIDAVKIALTKYPIEATARLLAHRLGSDLSSINLSDGVLHVEFKKGFLGAFDNTCSVRIELFSIDQTLKQFSAVKKVIISAEGTTPEELLSR